MKLLSRKRHMHPIYGLLVILFFSIHSCGETDYSTSTSGTGSAKLSVNWVGAPIPKETDYYISSLIDCDERGISTVSCTIYDINNGIVKTAGPWNCSDHAATIEKIPAGYDYIFVITGKDSSGNIVYRGEAAGITISNDEITVIGEIEAYIFRPTLSMLPKETIELFSDILLEWEECIGASKYQIEITNREQAPGLGDFAFLLVKETTPGSSTTYTFLPSDAYKPIGKFYWRITAIDEQGTKGKTSDEWSFTLIDQPVIVSITGPSDGESFEEGEKISFSGRATVISDYQVQSMNWLSNIDFELGAENISESTLDRENLSVGSHTITLVATVRDNNGALIEPYPDDSIIIHVAPQEWVKLIGGTGEDEGVQIAIDSNDNIYITGRTDAPLGGNEYRGENDVYVAKYDRNGIQQWEKLAGSNKFDRGLGISLGPEGNIYVTGYTLGNMGGIDAHSGLEDVFIAKYTPDGSNPWIRMLGSDGNEKGKSVAIDSSGYIYVTGYSDGSLDEKLNMGEDDIFIAKFEPQNGELQWLELVGTSADEWGQGISINNDSLYITGFTKGDLKGDGSFFGDRDIFIMKYSNTGNQQWVEVFGTSSFDSGEDITIGPNGDIYIGGYSAGNLDGNINMGGTDGFVAKYDSDGNKQWTEMFGSTSDDRIDGIAVDQNENSYITGNTYGDLGGHINLGLNDIIISKVNSTGEYQWTKVESTSEYEWGVGIVVKSTDDYAYITGARDVVLNGEDNPGEFDMFIWKVDLSSFP